ncbi:MAG: hypothetical protein CFE43_18270 [Burkholderiales bacterium PBB3]|nr:MAG: hypothetical protein CFE43_18270 [Burkholderiales bacterium PBB3]
MASKKTLYEILEVPADASYADIRVAHDRLIQALEAKQVQLGREDFELQSRLVRVAFTTLSTPLSRDAYDAHLTVTKEPASPAPLALVPMDKPDAVSLRADAMVLRAEAMALRADALALKAEVASGQFEPLHKPVGHFIPPILLASSRTLLLTLGTLAAVAMVIKLLFLFMVSQQPDDGGKARSQAEDKLVAQEYFQAHGVRPANRAELELLEANRRREEAAQRKADEDKRRAEDNERHFAEESRRRGDQVSAELQFAEERARQARQEEKRQQQEREEEKRRDAIAERERIEADRARWRDILTTPSNPR